MATATVCTDSTSTRKQIEEQCEELNEFTEPPKMATALMDWACATGDEAIIRALMYEGCLQAAYDVQEVHRPSTYSDSPGQPGENKCAGKALCNNHMAVLMGDTDWVIGGKRFEDLTKAELLQIARRLRAQARGMNRRAKMIEETAAPMERDDQTVKEYYSAERVEAMKKELSQ